MIGLRSRADVATWGRRDVGTSRRGDVATWGRRDVGTSRRGDVATWGRRDVGTSRRDSRFHALLFIAPKTALFAPTYLYPKQTPNKESKHKNYIINIKST